MRRRSLSLSLAALLLAGAAPAAAQQPLSAPPAPQPQWQPQPQLQPGQGAATTPDLQRNYERLRNNRRREETATDQINLLGTALRRPRD